MKKKLFAMFVLAIFIFSVIPLAAADDDSEKSSEISGSNALTSTDSAKTETKAADSEDETEKQEGNQKIEIKAAEIKRISEIKENKRISEIKEKIGEKIEKIKELKIEDFREFQKQQLMIAVEKCRENNLNPELCEKKLEKRTELIGKLKEKDLERLQKIEEKRQQSLKEISELKEKEEFAKFDKAKAFKARTVQKAKLEEEKIKYEAAKEDYEKAKESYKDVKEKLDKIKDKIEECRESNSTECQQIREQAKENAKNFLLNTANMIINALEKLKSKIVASEDLSEEEAAKLIADIDAKIAAIKDAKTKIESAATNEEIKEAAKLIKEEWEKTKPELKKASGKLINSHVGEIVVRAKHLEAKLQRILARMAEEGKNTAEIQPLIDEFSAKVKEAMDKYELAMQKYKEAATPGQIDEIVKQANAYLKEAQAALKEAHEKLGEIVKKIKETTGGEILEEEDIEEKLEEKEEIEIEVEIEEGKAKVKTEINETESEFTLNITDKEEIISEIAVRTNLSRETIEKNIKFEIEEEAETQASINETIETTPSNQTIAEGQQTS